MHRAGLLAHHGQRRRRAEPFGERERRRMQRRLAGHNGAAGVGEQRLPEDQAGVRRRHLGKGLGEAAARRRRQSGIQSARELAHAQIDIARGRFENAGALIGQMQSRDGAEAGEQQRGGRRREPVRAQSPQPPSPRQDPAQAWSLALRSALVRTRLYCCRARTRH